jgi:predicted DNA-binding protein (UPF0251 family)
MVLHVRAKNMLDTLHQKYECYGRTFITTRWHPVMPRPRKCRRIRINPVVRFYKPQGIPIRQLRVIAIKDEELEALSLADGKGLNHEAAAALMNVSRSTFSRILAQARMSVATALSEGAALKIGGGDFQLVADEDAVEPASENTKGTDDASNG